VRSGNVNISVEYKIIRDGTPIKTKINPGIDVHKNSSTGISKRFICKKLLKEKLTRSPPTMTKTLIKKIRM
jgi:hypothetical protein